MHVCVDGALRLPYTEVVTSEGQVDATTFLERALAWFTLRVTVQRVMTDNGSAYPQIVRQDTPGSQSPPCANPTLHLGDQRQGRALIQTRLRVVGIPSRNAAVPWPVVDIMRSSRGRGIDAPLPHIAKQGGGQGAHRGLTLLRELAKGEIPLARSLFGTRHTGPELEIERAPGAHSPHS